MSETGTPFGRYALIEKIATGGMAELYRAVIRGPEGFSKTVAIKKILPALVRDPRFREMFVHEGRVMGGLSHRNLVQLFELGEQDGEFYLCFEFVAGCDLGALLGHGSARGGLPPALAVWIARELCRGLDYVHSVQDEQGRPLHIVHRDITPQNVLLSLQGEVKLGDFGIAKSIAQQDSTRRGQIKGKLQYLAPEQARGDELGPHADLYAVGLLLWEMLAGQRYLQGATEIDILQQAARPQWRPPRPSGVTLPDGLLAVLRRALRPQPEERYASAAALGRELAELQAELAGPADEQELARRVFAVLDSGAEALPPSLATLDDVRSSPDAPADGLALSAELLSAPRTVSLAGVESVPRGGSGWQRGLLVAAALALLGLGSLWWLPHAPAVLDDVGLDDRVIVARVPAALDAGASAAADASAGLAVEAVPGDAGPGDRSTGIDATIEFALPELPRADRPRPGRRPGQRSKPVDRVKPGTRQAASLRQSADRLRDRLRRRGVLRHDLPQLDLLQTRIRKQLRRGQLDAAAGDLAELEQAVDRLAIDRGFVERKILRLQRTLERAGQAERFEDRRRTILDHALHSRFEAANAELNRAFAELK